MSGLNLTSNDPSDVVSNQTQISWDARVTGCLVVVWLVIAVTLSVLGHWSTNNRNSTSRKLQDRIQQAEQAGGAVQGFSTHPEHITHLQLGRNSTDRDLGQWKGCTRLSHVSLAGSQISNDSLSLLSEMKFLHFLDLSHTSITDDGLIQFSQQLNRGHRFDTLNLAATGVTSKSVTHLLERHHIRRLDLGNLELTDADLAKIPVERVQALYLCGNPVTEKCLSQIASISRLRLGRNQISADALVDFPTLKTSELELIGFPLKEDQFGRLLAKNSFTYLRLERTGLTDEAARHFATQSLTSLYLGD
ncbi:MAG: hypothetical protein KDA87_23670, partial [Planctomycetales bacterium]|nr:hypothetical protein [Planctomycetales bacterium]